MPKSVPLINAAVDPQISTYYRERERERERKEKESNEITRVIIEYVECVC